MKSKQKTLSVSEIVFTELQHIKLNIMSSSHNPELSYSDIIEELIKSYYNKK